jgi:hypothetical protein
LYFLKNKNYVKNEKKLKKRKNNPFRNERKISCQSFAQGFEARQGAKRQVKPAQAIIYMFFTFAAAS